jgi:hypothetical protein
MKPEGLSQDAYIIHSQRLTNHSCSRIFQLRASICSCCKCGNLKHCLPYQLVYEMTLKLLLLIQGMLLVVIAADQTGNMSWYIRELPTSLPMQAGDESLVAYVRRLLNTIEFH